MTKTEMTSSRPPRGGRGLKYVGDVVRGFAYSRPPRGGRGLKSLGEVVTAILG